jgi:hypothetical protein
MTLNFSRRTSFSGCSPDHRITRLPDPPFLNRRERRTVDGVNGNSRHAPEINRALAKAAGAAFDGMLDNPQAMADRPRFALVR